jgi:hypothetical protein
MLGEVEEGGAERLAKVIGIWQGSEWHSASAQYR